MLSSLPPLPLQRLPVLGITNSLEWRESSSEQALRSIVIRDARLYREFGIIYLERMTIQLDVSPTKIEPMPDYVIRRPGIPRWWNPVARPHVAVVMRNPMNGGCVRYFLSKCGEKDNKGRTSLDVGDIGSLPEGTHLEVRYSATKANLYKLEMVGAAACWRWINRSQGLQSFETESIDWDYPVDSSLESNKYTSA